MGGEAVTAVGASIARPQNTANETGGRPMAAPTGATLPLPSKKKNFHLIRPVCALGTFPSRGRLENAFLFLVLWFFDSLKKVPKPIVLWNLFIDFGMLYTRWIT